MTVLVINSEAGTLTYRLFLSVKHELEFQFSRREDRLDGVLQTCATFYSPSP